MWSFKLDCCRTESIDGWKVRLILCMCLDLQETSASSRHGSLEGVVEQLARFRSQVRAFALARHDSPTGPGLSPERIPLLKACDALRNDLAPLGVILKVFWLGNPGATCTRPHVTLVYVFATSSGQRSRLNLGNYGSNTHSKS